MEVSDRIPGEPQGQSSCFEKQSASLETTESSAKNGSQRCHLTELPAELFEKVIGPVIRSGELAILGASPEIHDRVQYFLPKHTTFRIHTQEQNGDYRGTATLVPNVSAANALNIDIKLELLFDYHVPEGTLRGLGILGNFLGQNVKRRVCHILITVYGNDVHRETPKVHLQLFRELTGFQSVIVEMESGYSCDRKPGSEFGRRGLLLRTKNKPFYTVVRNHLEEALGPASWLFDDVQGGQCLEFSPRRYLATIAPQPEGPRPA